MLIFNVNKNNRFGLEAISKGNQRKWVTNGVFLKADSMGYESIAEIIASELECHTIGCDFVQYNLCKIIEGNREYEGCASNIFLNEDEKIISFYRILEYYAGTEDELNKLKRNYTGVNWLNKLVSICSEVTKIDVFFIYNYLSYILKLDALLLNEDRHYNNLAFVRLGDGSFRTAPIFDNGLSLLADTEEFPLNKSYDVRKVKAQPFSTSFTKQAKYLSDFDLLKIDADGLLYKLDNFLPPFKKSEYSRAVKILKSRLRTLKGVVWEDV